MRQRSLSQWRIVPSAVVKGFMVDADDARGK